jgi:hypothetical protein
MTKAPKHTSTTKRTDPIVPLILQIRAQLNELRRAQAAEHKIEDKIGSQTMP